MNVRTICKTDLPSDAVMLGRMYRSRQTPLVRAACLRHTLHIEGSDGKRARTVHPAETLEDEFVGLMCCNGRSPVTKGLCVYYYRTTGEEQDCKINELHMVLIEHVRNMSPRFVHITVHPNEMITGVRTNEALSKTGFLRTELKYTYPTGTGTLIGAA